MGTCTFSMDDTLWDTLTIEVREEIDVVEICAIIPQLGHVHRRSS